MSIPTNIKEIIIDLVNYGLPILAFLGSMLSLFMSRKANKLSNRVMEIEKELKEIQLEKIHKELEDLDKSCIEARIIKESRERYKLKIWNSGKATAFDVDFDEKNDTNIICRDKVPYEFLESGKSFEEIVILTFGMKDKFILKTKWKDKSGKEYEKDNIISF